MEKIMKLAALMREAKDLIDEIESEAAETGISIIDVQADWINTSPKIHFFMGLPKVAGYAPVDRKLVECESGNYWKDETIMNGVSLFEVDTDKKEGVLNASVAV